MRSLTQDTTGTTKNVYTARQNHSLLPHADSSLHNRPQPHGPRVLGTNILSISRSRLPRRLNWNLLLQVLRARIRQTDGLFQLPVYLRKLVRCSGNMSGRLIRHESSNEARIFTRLGMIK